MRIGINALYLLPGRVGGSETYVRNLVKWLARVDGSHEYYVFVNKESAGVFDGVSPCVRVVSCPVRAGNRAARIFWEQVFLPVRAARLRLDVLLCAGMTAPFISPVPPVAVIYDLQHINQPQNFSPSYLFFLRTIIYLSAKRARGVITLSRKSKRDIVTHYNIASENVDITYLASEEKVFHTRGPEETASIRKKYNLPERYVYYAASSLPHKNYERLLLAFKKVKETDGEIKLVLTGARDYGGDVVAQKIHALGLGGDVVFLGWLPFEDIPLIYCAAEVFVFPSLHEGFGIPVLEAMSSGVPVVCSSIEPITEVAGDAAVLVDPFESDDIARGILSVIKDGGTQRRLRDAGLRRAALFSWEKTARDTLAILAKYSRARRRGAL